MVAWRISKTWEETIPSKPKKVGWADIKGKYYKPTKLWNRPWDGNQIKTCPIKK